MFCNNQTHVIVISSIFLALTGISVTGYFLTHINGGLLGIGVGFQAAIYIFYVFSMTSQILSIIGAIKNNKCLLVPFMVCLVLKIVLCIGVGIFVVVLIGQYDLTPLVPRIFIPLSITIGVCTYFLTLVIKFYKELSSGWIDGVQPGMVLPTCRSPPVGESPKVPEYTLESGPEEQTQNIEIPYIQFK